MVKTPTKDRIQQEFQNISKQRDSLDFEIDGIIFKYNQFKDRESAGKTEHHPKWQIALKFPSDSKETVLKKIMWQVGRTGVITPVAKVEPVDLGGATINRATLHNLDFLLSLDIIEGDMVEIERAGDVIPKIIGLIEKKSHNKELDIPEVCPSCGKKTERASVNLICPNPNCKEKVLNRIVHWVKVTDIEVLGPKTIEKLYDTAKIQHAADLYSLEKQELKDLVGKNGEKIYDNIQKTRNLPLDTFLAGLGIKTVGSKMAKTLATNFETFTELQNATIDDLKKLEGISDKTAHYIKTDVNDKNLYQPFLNKNLQIQSIKKEQTDSEDLIGSGKRMYVTGKIENMTKSKIKEICTNHGFDWSSYISKNMDILVIGENPGKSKLSKAKKSNVEILSWSDFKSKYLK